MFNKSSFLQCYLIERVTRVRSLFFKKIQEIIPYGNASTVLKTHQFLWLAVKKSNKQIQINKNYQNQPRNTLSESFQGEIPSLSNSQGKIMTFLLTKFCTNCTGSATEFKYLVLPPPPTVVFTGQRRCYSHTIASWMKNALQGILTMVN